MVGRPAGDLRRRLLLVAARRRRDQGREEHRPRLSRPEHQGRRRHEGRVPRRSDHDRDDRRPVRPGLPGLPADHPEAHLGQGDLQDDRRREVQRAAGRHRPVHPRRVEDRPVHARFVRNPNYWGTQGFEDEVVIQFFKTADTMVQALKAGEIDYARDPNADQLKAAQDRAEHQDGRRHRQRLDPARVQHLRHRHRQDDQGRRPRRRPCSTRRSATPSAMPSTTRRWSTRSSAASATSAPPTSRPF